MDMQKIEVENLKCNGCAGTIKKGLTNIEGVSNVTVDVENKTVEFEITSESVLDNVKQKLSKMGYPEKGTGNTTIQKAKSYVSCAIGKIENEIK